MIFEIFHFPTLKNKGEKIKSLEVVKISPMLGIFIPFHNFLFFGPRVKMSRKR
jgi:hypothetical protein